MKRNLISVPQQRSRSTFLKCRAPCAAARSLAANGRSPPRDPPTAASPACIPSKANGCERPLDRATFPVPSTSHAACGFPALRAPICFTPSLWDLSCWGDFRPVASHSIGVKQPSSVVQPPPIPSFPAEALSFLSKSSEPPGRFSLHLDV